MRRSLPVVCLVSALACAPGVRDSGDAGATTTDAGPGLVTGRACSVAADCGAGYDCYTIAPGGYCTPGSPGGPTACRDPEAPCPAGTVCSPVPWHAISGICMRPCASNADCRPGYVCDQVLLFPGESASPRSAERVCWTVCEPGVHQGCNDNPAISSLHGTCESDGTCRCADGFAKNPATGRCR